MLLIYVLSSPRQQVGHQAGAAKQIDVLKQAGSVAFARVAKSQALLGGREAVRVVVSGDVDSLLGVVALMNSVTTNARHPIHFYITLPSAVIPHFNEWVSKTRLHSVGLTVKPHPSQVPQGRPHYAKIFIKKIFPHLKGRFAYLDPDIIVQGDISELLKTPITSTQFAAFTKDCFSATRHRSLTHQFHYSSHLNLLHPAIHVLRINPNTCAPNTGVFVSEAQLWANASHHMQDLITTSTIKEPIHSSMADEGEAALLAVIYGHMAPLPRAWHLPDLGARARVSFSAQFLQSAKLLHWNGHFKPWSRKAAFSDVWLRYYLADPSGKYRPARISL
ncbi:Glycosyltransferase 8 domain-containing protein 1 [Chionoecetes opilio]|uniref:Glycosyltransferase 8 domain-containing protein 1 n=1 Tax=Chionoecetes opilio TaxID=41210 RepID=A0A8J4YN24_CHIOP|nr:Glycosyltransferase 8 domain-containing protein 1 [Chionoecetes opilio]